MRRDWKRALGSCCRIVGGSTAPNKHHFGNHGLPFIRAGHLEGLCNGEDLLFLPRVPEEKEKLLGLCRVPRETIIFAKSGMSIMKNRIYKAAHESYIVNHLAGVICGIDLLPNYLAYYLQWHQPSSLALDGSYPSIRLHDIRNMEVLVPPLETQRKIADALDKAQELIDRRKQQIEMLDEFLQSVFLDMFGDPVSNPKGWNMFPLGSIGKWQSGGTPPRKVTSFFRGDIPWFTAGELERIYVTESIEMITEEALAPSAAKLVETGSLLLGMYDTAALKSSINLVECSCNQAVAFAKLDQSKVCTEFAYYAIQIGRDYFKRFQRGVRQKNLNLSIIGSIKIPLPPIGLQSQFGKMVEATEKQRQLMENGLIEMENAFNSIMQRAFKGELFN